MRRGDPPIFWRCPECGTGVTSKFAKKRHLCGALTAHERPEPAPGQAVRS